MGTTLQDYQGTIEFLSTGTRKPLNEHYSFVQLPYGTMMINAHDPMIESTLVENQDEITELSRFARGSVLDVGANVGSHTINFAKTADIVYAFEPHPLTYYTLCANLLLNNVYNVCPFNRALGAYDGVTTMPNLDPTKPNTAMGVQVGVGTLPVPISTIDSLQLSPLHFMKIDVEGYELEVLKGASQTLARESMIVYVEVHMEKLVEPIYALMEELGYKGGTLFEVLTSPKMLEDSVPQFRYHMDDHATEHQYHLRPRAHGGLVVLTTGHLFYKEGRIQWVDAPSSPA